MPVIFQQHDVGARLHAIEKRLRALEISPSIAGLAQVVRFLGGTRVLRSDPLPFTLEAAEIDEATTPFTVARTGVVLVLASMPYFVSGGTANYGYIGLAVKNGADEIVASSIPLLTTNGEGISNATTYLVTELHAGDYSAIFQYWMDDGDTTTMTVELGSVDVFRMGEP